MKLSSNIKKIFTFKFVQNLGFIGGILIPFFTIWGGLSMWQVMFLQSWFMGAMFLLEIPTGVVADKWSRKQSLIIGAIFGSLGGLLYIVYPNFYWFLMCETLLALSGALFSGANEAIIFDSLKEDNQEKNSKTIFSFLENSKLFGIMIGAPIGSLVAKYIDIRAPFFYGD